MDKSELLAAVSAARTKAQNAAERLRLAREQMRHDAEIAALELHYNRAITELEEAINAAGVTEYE